MRSIGPNLEDAGWRQGSLVKQSDIQNFHHSINLKDMEGALLIVASQSCDIANNDLSVEPFVECSIARIIDAPLGENTYNKNPRKLHTQISCNSEDERILLTQNLELKAFEKINVPKELFESLTPDTHKVLQDKQLHSYVGWLSARYSRPALPTTFNNQLRDADPKGKLRKKAKQANEQLTGIYVQITPDREIDEHEAYSVNLIGLLPADHDGDTSKPETAIKAYADAFKKAGMEVSHAVRTEDKISIAVIKRYKRLSLDDLSYREDTPFPLEASTDC